MKITLTLDEAKFHLARLFAQNNQIAEISIDIPITEFVQKIGGDTLTEDEKSMVASHNFVEAIKSVRVRMGTSLMLAKKLVDAYIAQKN